MDAILSLSARIGCQAARPGGETASRPRIPFFGAAGARITGRWRLIGHNAVISPGGGNNGIDGRETQGRSA